MKTHKILIFCATLLAFFVSTDVVSACSFVRSGTIDTEFDTTPNVAIFKLQSVEKLAEGEKGYGVDGIKQSKLTVEKVFKGNLKVGDILTFAQGGGADCVWTFSEKAVGNEYLFYLDAKPDKDKIWAAITCSRSNSVKYAAADLLYLEKMAKVRGKTRLSGAITQSIRAAVEGEESSYHQLAGRKVRVSGNGKNIELKTDENGVYEIYDLPVGKYKVTPEKVNGYKFTREEKSDSVEVEIEAKSHTEQDFDFSIDNAIRGKLFDANGKSLKDVCLDLLPVRGKKPPYFYQADCTDENGKFEFEEIPAGTYVIVVNDDGELSSSEPFGTFYYPSATRREDAAAITIGAGDFRDDLIVNAPQTIETVTMTGVLLFEDGKPVAKESVKFFAETENSKPRDKYAQADARTATDEKGQFSVRILKGQKGKLFGSMYSYIGEYDKCPKLDKIIRAKGDSAEDIETPPIEIDAINDLSGIELKFPFPGCKKAKIE